MMIFTKTIEMNEKLMTKEPDIVLGVKSSIDSLLSNFNTEFVKRQNQNTAPIVQQPIKMPQLDKLNILDTKSDLGANYY